MIMRRERLRAKVIGDDDGLSEIDGVIEQMRADLVGDEKRRFDESLARPAAEDTADAVDVSVVGLWASVAGAAAMFAALFLPQLDATGFSTIVHNTLIQNGNGW